MTPTPEFEPHPLCLMFPEMSADDYFGLLKSIREDGPTRPVTIFEGKILDGRHRYRACLELGIDPPVVEYRGQNGSPLRFVLAENLHRRQMSKAEKAALALEVKRRLEAETRVMVGRPSSVGDDAGNSGNNSRISERRHARDEAAKIVGVNPHYVSDAERIEEASPETFAAVKAGLKSIPQAKRELGLAKPKPEPEPEPKVAVEPDDDDPWVDDGPEPEPEPNCIIDGVPGYDADVARLKALGKIPEGVTPTVESGDADEVEAVMEAVREEQIEGAAKVDDLTDDEWLATLPLTGQLEGVSLRRFRIEAVTFRRMESTRRAARRALNDAECAAKKPSSWSGKVHAMWSWPIRMSHPSQWRKCSPPDKGGCDGTGVVPVIGGQCGECEGGGYVVR